MFHFPVGFWKVHFLRLVQRAPQRIVNCVGGCKPEHVASGAKQDPTKQSSTIYDIHCRVLPSRSKDGH